MQETCAAWPDEAAAEGEKEETMRFDQWMKEVDSAVWLLVGCSVYDLPNTDFAFWYEDGLTLEQAARMAIKEAV